MVNWKELGEVPDSDDEGLDSQESLGDAPARSPTPPLIPSPRVLSVPGDDIWSIPSSSGEHTCDKPSITEAPLQHGSACSPTGKTLFQGDCNSAGLGDQLLPPSAVVDEGQQTKPNDGAVGSGELLAAPVAVSRESPHRALTTTLEILLSENKKPTIATSVRRRITDGARSLRPRKPIQQHPYLLENAHYNKFMKSHGVRPVRVVLSSAEPTNGRDGDDSQEQDFVSAESQLESGDKQPECLGESQSTVENDSREDDSGDELALSPSPRTSSPRRVAVISSQLSNDNQTDDTSLAGEEDLPTLNELVRQRPTPSGAIRKRRSSPKISSRSKRLRQSMSTHFSPPPSVKPRANDVPDFSRASESPLSRHQSGLQRSPRDVNAPLINFSSDNDNAGASLAQPTVVITSDSENESGSDLIRQNSKRIKGVLPASWLRLDQQNVNRNSRKTTQRRSPSPSSPRFARRGVALPREGNIKTSTTSDILLEYSANGRDDGAIAELQTQESLPMARWFRDQMSDTDDGLSAREEDAIDMMLSGPKRKRSAQNIDPQKKRKRRSNTFQGQPRQKLRQPKISNALNGSGNPKSSTTGSAGRGSMNSANTLKAAALRHRKTRIPPMLSILDVVEPEPPSFIRIAARSAKKRSNLGKSSPSRKCINLGNRRDNIDALSVLRDWKSGKIEPKIPGLPSNTAENRKRVPLQELPRNMQSNHKTTKQKQPNKPQQQLVKQSSIHESLVHEPDRKSGAVQHKKKTRGPGFVTSRIRNTYRPAQLETIEQARPGRPGFVAGKRALDAVYKKSRKEMEPFPNIHVEQFITTYVSPRSINGGPDNDIGPVNLPTPTRNEEKAPRSRFRKRYTPQSVDITAARFTHATDQLPLGTADVPATRSDDQEKSILAGLGPFGAQYSQHFEIFVLDAGVFFHESTLIGGGYLERATATGLLEKHRQSRPRSTYQFGDQSLQWGPWDDTTSSEFGILLDWITEQCMVTDICEPLFGSKLVGAADFILDYVQKSLSFQEAGLEKSFVSRCIETLTSFVNRVEGGRLSRDSSSETERSTVRSGSEVLTRLLLISCCGLRLCQESSCCLDESFQMEEVFKKLASLSAKELCIAGFQDVRAAYDSLQQLAHRERGIRNDRQSIISWVILIKLLEHLQLHRASFWDITSSAMSAPCAISTCTDASYLETLWENLFTLLPLGEFDDSGIYIRGMRRAVPLTGWTMPQQMVERVLQLYGKNHRQSASFNDYCRAVVGRCHYLIQEWGWNRCSGIVGIIFDFFGSQNLAHLRNEEAYKSPRFLEDLASSPSLSIDPEDRCFHIFVKMLGLAISRLQRLGLTKDIRNMVARILPNHNRQYLKENTIHQHDLAALRNHHDLLCTLFWAAPPDLRPQVHLIEKLVIPASSHREACLINLRAWEQLALFVVSSSSEDKMIVYKSFMSWQNNFFQQVLNQYLSVASDIQQQILDLSKDVIRTISPNIIDAMVSKNKAAAMDVLHASVVSSLAVLNQAPSLELATICLNTAQLKLVFTEMDWSSPKTDWRIMQVAIEIVERYLDRLEKALEEQYSNDANSIDPQHTEDAVLMLDHKLARELFVLTRRVSSLPTEASALQESVRAACTEKAIVTSAKLASRFIQDGVSQLSRFFKAGGHSIFETRPDMLGLVQRKYLPLFIATLVKHNVFDFKDIGSTIPQLWMLSIVKPLQFLGYENYFGEVLKQHNLPCVQKAFIPVGIAPDYDTNLDYFACAVSSMRRSLREANSGQRTQLRTDSKNTLKLVMMQMRGDLQSIKEQTAAHGSYVLFVRQVIALIRSYGGDMCPVDQFFYQISPCYSPSVEDPQLQTAGIIAYGIRFGEGEATAIPILFHYLLNNLRMAIANDKLDEQRIIIEKAMGNGDVLSFMVSRMLPAIIGAVRVEDDAWPWLDVYGGALQSLLTRSCLPPEIGQEHVLAVIGIVEATLCWFKQVQDQSSSTASGLAPKHLRIMTGLVGLMQVLQPSLALYSCLTLTAVQHTRLDRAATATVHCQRWAAGRPSDSISAASGLETRQLLDGVTTLVMNDGCSGHIDNFTKEIVEDVRKSWIVSDGHVRGAAAKEPGRGLSSKF